MIELEKWCLAVYKERQLSRPRQFGNLFGNLFSNHVFQRKAWAEFFHA
jgi:hypothetical protein